eukprot:SAG11_NODE_8295_length_1033_cov_1.123126_2_plen_199_part_00
MGPSVSPNRRRIMHRDDIVCQRDPTVTDTRLTVRAQVKTVTSVVTRVDMIVNTVEAGVQDLLSGSIPRLVDTIMSAEWAQVARNATVILSSISTGTRAEIPFNTTGLPVRTLQDIAEFTSFGASITSKLVDLQQQNSLPEIPNGTANDGGLMLGFLGRIGDILMVRLYGGSVTNPPCSCLNTPQLHRHRPNAWFAGAS